MSSLQGHTPALLLLLASATPRTLTKGSLNGRGTRRRTLCLVNPTFGKMTMRHIFVPTATWCNRFRILQRVVSEGHRHPSTNSWTPAPRTSPNLQLLS
ncbi:hypothetical protein BDA96_07G129800 [Sorghum bicolor]|uniref:Secreted protein n=2 Tax=Sorghum bicolor TaxID=4558 RepID=A0A921QMA0_SORBI|nr:hypothetical protein BDA96_07G129800 [Sorghum bicolor]KXG25105.1 hypothetical protein SORBI_3007G120700 [Sorghum bicolor]